MVSHNDRKTFLMCSLQVVIKEKVLELLLYFTKHEEEEVKTKAIIGLGKIRFLLVFLLAPPSVFLSVSLVSHALRNHQRLFYFSIFLNFLQI